MPRDVMHREYTISPMMCSCQNVQFESPEPSGTTSKLYEVQRIEEQHKPIQKGTTRQIQKTGIL